MKHPLLWRKILYCHEYCLKYKLNSDVVTILAEIKEKKRVYNYRIIRANIYSSKECFYALKLDTCICGSTKKLESAKEIIEKYYENQNKKI